MITLSVGKQDGVDYGAYKYGANRPLVEAHELLSSIFGPLLATPRVVPATGECEAIQYVWRNEDGRDILDEDARIAETISAEEWASLKSGLQKLKTLALQGNDTLHKAAKAFSLPHPKNEKDLYRRCRDPRSGEDKLIVLWGVYRKDVGNLDLVERATPASDDSTLIALLPMRDSSDPLGNVSASVPSYELGSLYGYSGSADSVPPENVVGDENQRDKKSGLPGVGYWVLMGILFLVLAGLILALVGAKTQIQELLLRIDQLEGKLVVENVASSDMSANPEVTPFGDIEENSDEAKLLSQDVEGDDKVAEEGKSRSSYVARDVTPRSAVEGDLLPDPVTEKSVTDDALPTSSTKPVATDYDQFPISDNPDSGPGDIGGSDPDEEKKQMGIPVTRADSKSNTGSIEKVGRDDPGTAYSILEQEIASGRLPPVMSETSSVSSALSETVPDSEYVSTKPFNNVVGSRQPEEFGFSTSSSLPEENLDSSSERGSFGQSDESVEPEGVSDVESVPVETDSSEYGNRHNDSSDVTTDNTFGGSDSLPVSIEEDSDVSSSVGGSDTTAGHTVSSDQPQIEPEKIQSGESAQSRNPARDNLPTRTGRADERVTNITAPANEQDGFALPLSEFWTRLDPGDPVPDFWEGDVPPRLTTQSGDQVVVRFRHQVLDARDRIVVDEEVHWVYDGE